MTKINKYILQILEPREFEEEWVEFESDVPFMNIAKGDYLNHLHWKNSDAPNSILRVTSIEHIISEHRGDITHRIRVYSKRERNKSECRFE